MAAAGHREFEWIISVGAKLQANFRGVMQAATNRLAKLKSTALSMGKTIGLSLVGGIAGAFAGFAIADIFKSIFGGAIEQAVEARHRTRELGAALMKNIEIAKGGEVMAMRQLDLIYRQVDALKEQGVISEDMYKQTAVTLAEIGVPTQQIIDSLEPMGDLIAQLKGVKASEGDFVELSNAMGRAINTGQLRPLRQYIKDLTTADQIQFKALATRDEQWKFLIDKMKYARGANIREGKTEEGTAKRLQNRMQQLREEIGYKLLPIQAKMAELWMKILSGPIQPAILRTLDAIGKAFDWVVDLLYECNKAAGEGEGGLLSTLANLGKTIGELVASLWNLGAALLGFDTKDSVSAVDLLKGAIKLLNWELKNEIWILQKVVWLLKQMRAVIPSPQDLNPLKPSNWLKPTPMARGLWKGMGSLFGGAWNAIGQIGGGGGGGGGGGLPAGAGAGGATYTPTAAQVAGTADLNLAAQRAALANELKDPAVAARFYSNMQTEVGAGNPARAQAYMETVFNRALARNKSLMATISDTGYYPAVSLQNQNVSKKNIEAYNALLDQVVAGSNISDYATGNESGNVHSGGAHVSFASGGERFVHENADVAWIRRQKRLAEQTPAVAAGGGAPYYLAAARGMQLGGVVSGLTSAILGERGPEAVIPLGGGRRATGLLDFASRALGFGGIGGGTRNHLNFMPNITIHGNAGEMEQRAMDSRLRDLARDFINQFVRAQTQERRLSFDSGYG
jgi:hypothetical protein